MKDSKKVLLKHQKSVIWKTDHLSEQYSIQGSDTKRSFDKLLKATIIKNQLSDYNHYVAKDDFSDNTTKLTEIAHTFTENRFPATSVYLRQVYIAFAILVVLHITAIFILI